MRRCLPLWVFYACGMFSACSSNQFSGMEMKSFDTTPVTESQSLSIEIANASESEEQHLLAANFDPASNTAGHFRIDSLKVGDRAVGQTDIVLPPGSVLTIKVTYAPQNLETTLANYGGWETGKPQPWEPKPVDDGEEKGGGTPETLSEAVHRALIQLVYKSPQSGIMYVQLVGTAISGPNGEISAGGRPGECTPGDGIACYTGGFAVDIPSLAPGGPKDLVMTGAIRIAMAAGGATLKMSDFPLVLMYLRSSEIPQLPAGVTATLVISGAPDVTAEGTFDGARLSLSGVAFRIRVALGELQPEEVTPGLASLVDFVIENLEITTTEPLAQGAITLHLETMLSQSPSGNELFDQFLSGAKVVAIMKGQLAF